MSWSRAWVLQCVLHEYLTFKRIIRSLTVLRQIAIHKIMVFPQETFKSAAKNFRTITIANCQRHNPVPGSSSLAQFVLYENPKICFGQICILFSQTFNTFITTGFVSYNDKRNRSIITSNTFNKCFQCYK